MKDIPYCNANTIANTIAQTFQKYSLMPIQYLTFLTNNTNYMSGKTGDAVTKFNQITGANTFQIPCSLHVIHIVLNAFETTAFGKTFSTIGFSNEKHSYNLLYLA